MKKKTLSTETLAPSELSLSFKLCWCMSVGELAKCALLNLPVPREKEKNSPGSRAQTARGEGSEGMPQVGEQQWPGPRGSQEAPAGPPGTEEPQCVVDDWSPCTTAALMSLLVLPVPPCLDD